MAMSTTSSKRRSTDWGSTVPDTEVVRRVEMIVQYGMYDVHGNIIELAEEFDLRAAERYYEQHGGLGLAKRYHSEWIHV